VIQEHRLLVHSGVDDVGSHLVGSHLLEDETQRPCFSDYLFTAGRLSAGGAFDTAVFTSSKTGGVVCFA